MFSRLLSFLTAWTRRDRFEDALDDEVRFHLEACTEDLVRAGVPRREAARHARVRFGSIEHAKDDCRQARGLRLADELGRMAMNIRLALRMLLKSPAVATVAVLSLSLHRQGVLDPLEQRPRAGGVGHSWTRTLPEHRGSRSSTRRSPASSSSGGTRWERGSGGAGSTPSSTWAFGLVPAER